MAVGRSTAGPPPGPGTTARTSPPPPALRPAAPPADPALPPAARGGPRCPRTGGAATARQAGTPPAADTHTARRAPRLRTGQATPPAFCNWLCSMNASCPTAPRPSWFTTRSACRLPPGPPGSWLSRVDACCRAVTSAFARSHSSHAITPLDRSREVPLAAWSSWQQGMLVVTAEKCWRFTAELPGAGPGDCATRGARTERPRLMSGG